MQHVIIVKLFNENGFERKIIFSEEAHFGCEVVDLYFTEKAVG